MKANMVTFDCKCGRFNAFVHLTKIPFKKQFCSCCGQAYLIEHKGLKNGFSVKVTEVK